MRRPKPVTTTPPALVRRSVGPSGAPPCSTMARRAFLHRLSLFAGSATAIGAGLQLLEGGRALAAIVPEGDPRLNIAFVNYDSPYGPMKAYTARLRETRKQPSVLVVHDALGLTPHYQDIVRRLAIEGYYAMAVDGLSPLGGTPPDSDQARKMIPRLDPAGTLQAFDTGLAWLKSNLNTTDRIGAVGFGWGGALVNRMATSGGDLTAGVVYDGAPPPLAEVSKIKAALLLQNVAGDRQVGARLSAYIEALKAAGVRYETYTYQDTDRGFSNDTRPDRYDEAAAKLAWSRTVAFLKAALA